MRGDEIKYITYKRFFFIYRFIKKKLSWLKSKLYVVVKKAIKLELEFKKKIISFEIKY